MNRQIHPIILGLGLVILAGCRSQPLTPPEQAHLQAARWQQAKSYDHHRLKGWDRQPSGILGLATGLLDLPGQWIAHASGVTPEAAVRQMYDSGDADQRRLGILYLSDRSWGRKGIYLQAYGEIALNDPDDLVRATAVRALNRARDRQAVPALVQAMGDTSVLVRVEAAKALANIPDQGAVGVLIRHLSDSGEDKEVRTAAADALREYRTLEVAQTLIRQLDNRQFAVAWQARISLWFMTGRDFAYDQAGWLGYITGPENPLG